MFLVVIPQDDSQYNVAVRHRPELAQEVDSYTLNTVVPWLRQQPGFEHLIMGKDAAEARWVANYLFSTAELAAVFVVAFDTRVRPYYEERGVRFEPVQTYEVAFQM